MATLRVSLDRFRRPGSGPRQQSDVLTLPAGPTPLHADLSLALAADVRVRLEGDQHRVQAEVRADPDLVQPCARCLEDVHLNVHVLYQEEWWLTGDPPADLAESDGPVLHRGVTDSVVDIWDGFWQNVALELPAKVLCTEACRGLCPVCGTNRNRAECGCAAESIDPRLAVLAQWPRPKDQPPTPSR